MCVDAVGRPNGPVSIRQGQTQTESGAYTAGLRSGVWTMRSDATHWTETTYVEGRETGVKRVWANGRLTAEYSKHNGLSDGESWSTGSSGTWRGTYAAGELGKCTAGLCPGPVIGFCTEPEIVNVLYAAQPDLAACYAPGATEQYETLTWKILGDGTTSVPLDVTPGTECLHGVLARLKFARPRGGLCMIRYGFHYKP